MKTLTSRVYWLIIGLTLSMFTVACSTPSNVETSSPNSETTTEAPMAETEAPATDEVAVAPSSYEIDFTQEAPDATLNGFSGVEPWGRWTDQSTASIAFDKSLPSDFVVVLNGQAFGNNANQDLTLTVGSQTQTFRLTPEAQEVKLEFKGVSPDTKELTFMIPEPISPKELGQGEDERKLGIGLTSLEIEELN